MIAILAPPRAGRTGPVRPIVAPRRARGRGRAPGCRRAIFPRRARPRRAVDGRSSRHLDRPAEDRLDRPRPGSRRSAGSAADRPCSRRRSRPGRRGRGRRRARARPRRRAGRRSPRRRGLPATPETLAEVVGSGPTAAASARGASCVGDAQPDRRGAAGQGGGQRDVGSLRDDDRQAARPERLGEGGRGRAATARSPAPGPRRRGAA